MTAIYRKFVVQDEEDGYRLTVGDYDNVLSTAGDALSQANGQKFTTKDADNDNEEDINCAITLGGGFWYNECNPEHVPFLGITGSGDNFKWDNHLLQSAGMYLVCP